MCACVRACVRVCVREREGEGERERERESVCVCVCAQGHLRTGFACRTPIINTIEKFRPRADVPNISPVSVNTTDSSDYTSP